MVVHLVLPLAHECAARRMSPLSRPHAKRTSLAPSLRIATLTPTPKSPLRPTTSTLIRRATTDPDDSEPPPYTALSVPLYSISTLPISPPSPHLEPHLVPPTDPILAQMLASFTDPRPSMNITTYTTPVGIKPERIVTIALYVGTMTWRNVRMTGRCVMQILTKEHLDPRLFELLGKKSGKNSDKMNKIQQQWRVIDWKGYSVFENAYGVMALEVCSGFTQCGDHEVVLCRVTDWETFEAASKHAPLYTGDLRAAGLLPS